MKANHVMSKRKQISSISFLALFTLIFGSASAFAADRPAADAPANFEHKLRIIVFGAHPDDAELRAGGVAMKWAALGHHVKMVSVTNGDAGHWNMTREDLAKRRLAEVTAADKLLGAETEVLPIHDGELEPTLENRRAITRVIRRWNADIVIAHRPWDYHPDHRYVGVLVQDAAFMVAVPMFCPETPALKKNPVFLYASDGFQKPYPFRPTVIVGIDEVFDRKVDALHELESQFYEGGALGNAEFVKGVPPASDVPARKAYLRRTGYCTRNSLTAAKYRDDLVKWYGPEKGGAIKYAEAFELCEYGSQPTEAELRALFPFFEKKAE
jgi:LmbE family N-acetylglucosaminyl deacetylase